MYPLSSQSLTVERSIPLVNTVITGDVPGMYLNPN
jgi:hypothetical protein